MPPLDRRKALHAAADATAAERAAPPPAEPSAALNADFRALYAANRDELASAIPLAAATLIGSAEIARIEYGKITRTYPPAATWIARVKGLMHGMIALQATGARLQRGTGAAAARQDALRLAARLEEATRLAAGLPAALSPAAVRVLAAATARARVWADGAPVAAGDTRAALAQVDDDLATILDRTGEAVYEELVAGLVAFRDDSTPEAWADCLVLVCGPPFGRRDSVEIAAGMEVLGRDALGTRLLYLDNVLTLEDAAKQAAGCVADRELGTDVFGDPMRMYRDLFGDTARRRAGGGFFPFMGPD